MTFVCPRCLRESWHPVDELVGWCGACEAFTRDSADRTRELIREVAGSDAGLAEAIERRLDNAVS